MKLSLARPAKTLLAAAATIACAAPSLGADNKYEPSRTPITVR